MCVCDMLGARRTTCMGMVPGVLDRMPVMVWTPCFLHAVVALHKGDPRPWLPASASHPSTAYENHKDEVLLSSSPSPWSILLLPVPIFLLWNVLASLPADVNILYF